jgi:hypothetical protein
VKREYAVLTTHDPLLMSAWLNEYGEDGWRVFSFTVVPDPYPYSESGVNIVVLIERGGDDAHTR